MNRMILILFATAMIALADPTETAIRGVVTDPTGAVISGARVVVRGATDKDTTSDGTGRYEIPALRPGSYTITVDRAGFEAKRKSMELIDPAHTVDVELPLTHVIESITVSSEIDAVEAFTKLPVTLHETPRSVSVIDSEQARDRNFRSVPEMLAYTPGMTQNSLRTGSYHFYARGYRMGPEDTRVDGFVGMNVGGGYGSSLFGVEQTVLLRGPAGLIYGSAGSPGGMIDLVTKKPLDFRNTRIDVRGGSYAGRGLSFGDRPNMSADFDSTGSVTRSNRVLYRSLFTLENQRYFNANLLDRNRYANQQFTIRLDRAGLYTITPVVQYARFNRPNGGGIVMSPSTSLLANDGISEPINTQDLSPLSVNSYAGGRIDETAQAGFTFRGQLLPAWSVNFAYRLLRNDTFIDQWSPTISTAAQRTLLTTQGDVQRTHTKSDTDRRNHNYDFFTSYDYRGRSWKNFTQVGAYTRVVSTRGTTLQGTAPGAGAAINIYSGIQRTPFDPTYPVIAKGLYATTTSWNGYFQNRTSIFDDKLVFTLGLGYGQNHPDAQPVQKGNLMPNLAVSYNASRALVLYYSYATSYNPVDPTLENGAGQRGSFDPTTGKNREIGAKFDLPGRRMAVNVSLFRNFVSNALVQTGTNDLNVNGNRFYLAAGSRQSKGAELSTDYRLTSDWSVMGSASYTSGIYTGNGPASAQATLAIPGSPTEKTPRWAYTTRTTYQRNEGRLAGVNLGLGLVWQGQRLGSNGARTFTNPDPLMLPSYSRVDFNLGYRVNEHLDFAVNLDNALDSLIFINATVGSAMEIAQPRNLTLRMGYRF
jgi:iron complex outermembrane recepter protein